MWSIFTNEAEGGARIYRSSFGRENDRFRENKPKTLVFNLIRTQRRRSRLVLDEIKLGGSFQILGLRRGRDQLVFVLKTKSINVESIATLSLFCPIEGHKSFFQISSQLESQKNLFAYNSFGKIQFLPPFLLRSHVHVVSP